MTVLRPFRFGVINEHKPSPREWVARARQAEDLGYATFLPRDHFIEEPFGDQFAPFSALMAAAAATTTLRVGTLVFDNDYRHPVVLAKEAVTLDLLADGRLELGMGAGFLRAEYEQAGLAYDAPGVRVGRLEEGLQVLKGLFDAEPFTYSGSYYTITDFTGFPRPQQRPHPPLLIAGAGKRILSLAGREADIVGLLNYPLAGGTLVSDPLEMSPQAVERKVAWIQQAAGERYSSIELSMGVRPVLTTNQRQGATQYVQRQGWNGVLAEDILAMPSVFIGSLDLVQVMSGDHG